MKTYRRISPKAPVSFCSVVVLAFVLMPKLVFASEIYLECDLPEGQTYSKDSPESFSSIGRALQNVGFYIDDASKSVKDRTGAPVTVKNLDKEEAWVESDDKTWEYKMDRLSGSIEAKLEFYESVTVWTGHCQEKSPPSTMY